MKYTPGQYYRLVFLAFEHSSLMQLVKNVWRTYLDGMWHGTCIIFSVTLRAVSFARAHLDTHQEPERRSWLIHLCIGMGMHMNWSYKRTLYGVLQLYFTSLFQAWLIQR